ncbi:MAG: TlpA family protein disulfide reductase [Candidatus Eisenbacteria sp.]|nr:TlpA family protein disulfide reductase [Candidatus Eisenbacteria bacterium]
MRNMHHAPGTILLLTFCLALSTASGASAESLAPDFTLVNLQGEKATLSEINVDHAVLVSFWATWCLPCPQEMQHLQRLYEKHAEQGLDILSISVDGNKTVAKVKPFVQGRRFTFPVLLDTNNDVMRLYRVKAVPAVFLLAPGRQLTYHHTGFKAGDEVALEAEIRKVLALPSVVAGKRDGAENSETADAEDAERESTEEESGEESTPDQDR